MANLRFLNSEFRNTESEKRIIECAKKLPPFAKITHIELDLLATEWKILTLERIPEDWYYIREEDQYIPIDKYWSNIMNMKDSNNEIKYPMISKVVMCVFAIFEANCSVERLFSQISHIVGKDRNRLS